MTGLHFLNEYTRSRWLQNSGRGFCCRSALCSYMSTFDNEEGYTIVTVGLLVFVRVVSITQKVVDGFFSLYAHAV